MFTCRGWIENAWVLVVELEMDLNHVNRMQCNRHLYALGIFVLGFLFVFLNLHCGMYILCLAGLLSMFFYSVFISVGNCTLLAMMSFI